jgi:hypothetical protein
VTADELAARLRGASYWTLFMASDGSEADALWDEAAAQELVGRADAEPGARLLAAELLTAHGADVAPETAAEAYVGGLRAGDVGNAWGLPGGPPGPLGRRVLALGEDAIAPLRDALSDETRLEFFGSREATYGNAFEWRAKDAAAELLAAILGRPFEPDRDPAARDAAIAELART